MKKYRILYVLFFVLLLAACGKNPQESDKKEDVGKMIESQRAAMKASSDAHQTVMDAIQNFDETKTKYATLKNMIKGSQDIQHSLIESLDKEATTPYRVKLTEYFMDVIHDRIKNEEELLKVIRLEDKEALVAVHDMVKKKDEEISQKSLTQLNELLKSKKAKTITALEK